MICKPRRSVGPEPTLLTLKRLLSCFFECMSLLVVFQLFEGGGCEVAFIALIGLIYIVLALHMLHIHSVAWAFQGTDLTLVSFFFMHLLDVIVEAFAFVGAIVTISTFESSLSRVSTHV